MYLLCLIVLFALWAQPMELLSLQLFCSHGIVITIQEWEKYCPFLCQFSLNCQYFYTKAKIGDCQTLHTFLSMLGEHKGFCLCFL